MLCKVVIAVLLLQGCGPKAKERRAERDDPLSPFHLDRYLKDLLPRVERSAGRPFREAPTVQLAGRASFDALLVAEQTLIYDKVMTDTPPELRRQLIEANTRSLRRGLLGKYGILDKQTYLCADALVDALQASETDPVHLEAWARLIVAHEITHALQDQHVDLLGLLDGVKDEDSLLAASAMWEGLATLVQEDVARELSLLESHDALIALQGWSRDGLEDARAYNTWAIYGQGRDFMAHHRRTSGADKMWEVLAHPPPNTAMLFRPETWAPEAGPASLDYAAILRGTEQHLTKGDWVISNTRLGELKLRSEASGSDTAPELEDILAHLEHAQALDLLRPDRSGAIRLLIFESAPWPTHYLDLLRREQTSAAAQVAAELDVPIEVLYQDLETLRSALAADVATLRTERIPLPAGGHRESRSAWVARGDALVVVRATDFRPGVRLGKTVTEVFARLDAARDPMQPGVAPHKTP